MNRKRRTLRTNGPVLRDFREGDFDCFLELRISPGDNVSGRDLDVEVRRDAKVFNAPGSTRIVRGPIRQSDLPAVDQCRREVIRTDARAERALADDWTKLPELEHEGAGFRGRTIQLVYEHHLYRRPRIYRSCNIVTATKHVVVERLALHPFDQVIGRDAAAVETL